MRSRQATALAALDQRARRGRCSSVRAARQSRDCSRMRLGDEDLARLELVPCRKIVEIDDRRAASVRRGERRFEARAPGRNRSSIRCCKMLRRRGPFRGEQMRPVDDLGLDLLDRVVRRRSPSVPQSSAIAAATAAGALGPAPSPRRACAIASLTTSRNDLIAGGGDRGRRARGRARSRAPRRASSSTPRLSLVEELPSASRRRAPRSAPRRWPRTGTDAAAACRRRGWSAP